jgi:hypothetical protein
MGKIESLLTSMYNYFVNNFKCYLEICKLVELLSCKGNKILKNIKTEKISMLSPSNRTLNEYQTLVVKMIEDNVSIIHANYEFFCNMETLLGLVCHVHPLLELVQGLSKFAWRHESFICEFLSILKLVG